MIGRDNDDTAQVWQLIEKQPVAMMTTEEDGRLVSRPMYSVVRPDENAIYFVTRLDSAKVAEIRDRAPVNLGYANPGASEYVSLSGSAATSQDRAKLRELWSLFAEAWLPEGPDGDDVALITVTPEEAKFWDSTSSKLLRMIRMLKAAATQTPPDGGRVREVSM
jgi:general stress protein 26